MVYFNPAIASEATSLKFGRLIKASEAPVMQEQVALAYGDEASSNLNPQFCAKVDLYPRKEGLVSIEGLKRKLKGPTLLEMLRFIFSMKFDEARIIQRLKKQAADNSVGPKAGYIHLKLGGLVSDEIAETMIEKFRLRSETTSAKVLDRTGDIMVQVRLPQ